jgi:hypothetical protein
MRDRRPEQRHEPIAEELVDRALITVHLGQRDPEEAIDHQMELLRPQPTASALERTMSQNSTLTCLRSPSTALRTARICSLICAGV